MWNRFVNFPGGTSIRIDKVICKPDLLPQLAVQVILYPHRDHVS